MSNTPDTTQIEWDYAPAPERTRPDIASEYGLFINGDFVEPHSGRTFATKNPATGRKLAMVSEADEVDVDRAVKAARAAGGKWAQTEAIGTGQVHVPAGSSAAGVCKGTGRARDRWTVASRSESREMSICHW